MAAQHIYNGGEAVTHAGGKGVGDLGAVQDQEGEEKAER